MQVVGPAAKEQIGVSTHAWCISAGATPPSTSTRSPDPEPGPGQVLLAMRASTICGSDIPGYLPRARQGDPAEMYQGRGGRARAARQVVASDSGRASGSRWATGSASHHISGCGQCDDCVRGYQISCSSPSRAAYGWQRGTAATPT